MSMSIYIAHRRNNASNALDVPSTDQKETSSVYDKNSQFACLGHMSSVIMFVRQHKNFKYSCEIFPIVANLLSKCILYIPFPF